MSLPGVNKPPALVFKIILLTLIPLVVVVGYIFKFQSLITFIYIPFLFLLSLHLNNYYLILSKPLKYYIYFFIITLLSVITATHLDLFLNETKTALGCLIFGFTLFNFVAYNPKSAKYLLISYIIATYIFSFYLFVQGALNVTLINDTRYRVEDELFNANLFSYYIFLALFSFYFLFEIYNNSKMIILAYLASLTLYVVVIFISGSRGGLLMFLLVNILYWVFIGFVDKPKLLKPAIIASLIIIFCLPFLNYGYTYVLTETNIGFRYRALLEEGEETSRLVIIKDAFDFFLSNPALGVGSGNFTALNHHKMFSHNNFMEILVNNGIFAFFFYVAAFLALIKETYSLFKRSISTRERKIFAVIILFVITFFVYSFFYVFMRVLPYTGFIFLLFAIAYIVKSFPIKEKASAFDLF